MLPHNGLGEGVGLVAVGQMLGFPQKQDGEKGFRAVLATPLMSVPPCVLPAALLVQGQYSRFEGITYPEPVQYSQYDQQAGESSCDWESLRLSPPPPSSFAFPAPCSNASSRINLNALCSIPAPNISHFSLSLIPCASASPFLHSPPRCQHFKVPIIS